MARFIHAKPRAILIAVLAPGRVTVVDKVKGEE
jgi:hypothetical protein